MLRARVVVTNALGLHARAAAQLVKLASTFESRITLARAGSSASADARSILSVLTLAAVYGTELEIVADGDDEEKALTAVQEIFANNFGEEPI